MRRVFVRGDSGPQDLNLDQIRRADARASAKFHRMRDARAAGALSLACIGCLTVAALVLPSGGAAKARVARSCKPPHTATIARDRKVRVYQTHDQFGNQIARACLYRTAKTYTLGGRTRDYLGHRDFVSPVLLSRAIVGWEESTADRYGEEGYEVKVLDLANGRVLHEAVAPSALSSVPYRAVDLVMDRAGSVAWISISDIPSASASPEQLFKSDTSRGAQLLDSSNGCCQSLRLTGKTLSWLDGGQTHTAEFAR